MIWVWCGFVLFILGMLAVDLFLVNRDAHEVRAREALRFTALTIVMAMAFAVCVYFIFEHRWLGFGAYYAEKFPDQRLGMRAVTDFLGAWILEYSLSVDNIFVMAVIFGYFGVPLKYQHRVLFWGILGALIMRGVMIGAGTTLIHYFDWLLAVFGVILLLTAVKMLRAGDEPVHPDKNIAVRIARKFYPVATEYDGQKFFTRLPAPEGKPAAGLGARAMTPLFLVLLVIETTDVVFAVDSIPAVIGITQDPFIVFTSNVFAILGLRSMYFALGAFMQSFKYLKAALVFILGFIGVKMLLEGVPLVVNACSRPLNWCLHHLGVVPTVRNNYEGHHIPNAVSLSIIAGILAVGVAASLLSARKERNPSRAPLDDLQEAGEIAMKNARRIAILVIGLTIVAFSIPIGFLPGPGGIAVAVLGLMVLATEFVWAQRVLKRLKDNVNAFSNTADKVARRTNPLLVPLVILIYWGAAIYLAHFVPLLERHTVRVYFVALGIFIPVGWWCWQVLVVARSRRRGK